MPFIQAHPDFRVEFDNKANYPKGASLGTRAISISLVDGANCSSGRQCICHCPDASVTPYPTSMLTSSGTTDPDKWYLQIHEDCDEADRRYYQGHYAFVFDKLNISAYGNIPDDADRIEYTYRLYKADTLCYNNGQSAVTTKENFVTSSDYALTDDPSEFWVMQDDGEYKRVLNNTVFYKSIQKTPNPRHRIGGEGGTVVDSYANAFADAKTA